jgi:hypothetical protein
VGRRRLARRVAPQAGATHFLEHLLFKGTRAPSAMEIAAAIDAVGGEMNAFTTKEYTCYYARVLDDDLPLAVDVVSDMVTARWSPPPTSRPSAGHPRGDRHARRRPRRPRARRCSPRAVRRHPLGRRSSAPSSLDRGDAGRTTIGATTARYRPDDGRRRGRATSTTTRSCAWSARRSRGRRWLAAATAAHPAPPRTTAAECRRRPGDAQQRPTEQANVVLGVPGCPRRRPPLRRWRALQRARRRHVSRLFQEVREKRGLAYSSTPSSPSYADAGLFGVYVGCQPGKVDEVLDVIRAELPRCAGTASPTPSSPAARGSCAAHSCSAWRTPARG